jgi:predicted transcriptional regulator
MIPMKSAKSIFDGIDEEEEERAIAEAEADVAAGRVVPHEEVVKWIKSWGMVHAASGQGRPYSEAGDQPGGASSKPSN